MKGIALKAGDHEICILTQDGKVECFGHTYVMNSYDPAPGPLQIFFEEYGPYQDFVMGPSWSCALNLTNQVVCGGYDTFGLLGQGISYEAKPFLIQTGGKVVKLPDHSSPVTLHLCLQYATGLVRCGGSNNYGELGNGTKDPQDPKLTYEDLNFVEF